MTSHELKDLLDKYSRGKCTRQEEDFILEWFNNIQTNAGAQVEDEVKTGMEARIWHKLTSTIERERAPRLSYWRRIAASIALLALLASVFFYAYRQMSEAGPTLLANNHAPIEGFTSIANTELKPRAVTLHDGTQVTLQPKSEIRFPHPFDKNKREVTLTGEAFFNVTRDTLRPFLVYTKEVVTRVLGTSFTIKAYDDDEEITVAVRTGKVSVYTRSGEEYIAGNSNREVILVPNQQAVYDRERDKVSRQLVEKPEIVLLKPTLFEMQYDGASVAKIFKVLEDNYGIDIEFDEEVLTNCILTTSMSDEGLYERIEIICKAIGAEYEITDAVIVIKSAGC